MAWYRCGGGGIPSSLKSDMNDVFNKKFGTVLQDYPPDEWPGTVNLMGPLPEKTVSGSIVAFSDGADAVLLKSCAVTIAPNLDGVSSVDVVQTGLQLLPVTIPSNGNGITYTDNGDGTFNASGTASATTSNRYVFTSTAMNTLKRGETYHISGCPSGGSSNTYKLQAWNASTSSQLAVDYGNGASFTMPTEGTINVRFVIYKGQEVDFTVKPMITAVQTTEHAEYNGTTHTAALGRTIYGGEVDVVNGTGTDENGNDFTFTPVPIITRLGDNTMWGDGDLSVTYRRDIDLALAQ